MSERRRLGLVIGFGTVAAVALAGGLLGAVGWLTAVGWSGIGAVALLAVRWDVL